MNTYTKLRNGDWGIRTTDTKVKSNELLVVTKKSGESKEERVGSVIYTGADYALCSIARNGTHRTSNAGQLRGRRTGCSCGSIEGNPRDSDCRQCQYDNE